MTSNFQLGAVSSSRYQSKRPRMTEEEEHDDDDHYEEEEESHHDEARRYQSPAPDHSNMVGLVCPR